MSNKMYFFGRVAEIPDDAVRMEVPVGYRCSYCRATIGQGDAGFKFGDTILHAGICFSKFMMGGNHQKEKEERERARQVDSLLHRLRFGFGSDD